MSCQEKGRKNSFAVQQKTDDRARRDLPAQGLMEKETLTPNYRPHQHRTHADMHCQLTLFFLLYFLAGCHRCTGQNSSIDVILFIFMCWAVF